MNSLKPLFVVAILAAVAYGVYVSINRNPEPATAPGSAPAWPETPTVQIPGPGMAAPQYPAATSGTGLAPQFSPSSATAPGGGPSAMAPLMTNSGAATAPSFTSPGTSNPPVGALGQGVPARYPYPSSGYPGTSDRLASPSAPPPAGNLPFSPDRLDSPALRSDSPPGSEYPMANPLPGRAPQNGNQNKFATYMQAVQMKLDEGGLAEAHLALSSVYDSPELPPEQAQKAVELLDQLAGTVIYSRRHLLEPPYRVQPGDTLERIAQTYGVSWQLLANINGIRDPQDLPGQELKIVRGPFSALIDLDKYELTLMLRGRYAGRFPIGIGRDHVKLEGSYVVCGKNQNPQYYGPDTTIDANDPNNPYGEFWIGLGDRIGQPGKIGIHGTNDSQNLHRIGRRGAICLGDQDIRDVFGILSIGSRVVIQR